METCINYRYGDDGFFSSDERRWIKHILELKEKHPDEVEIIARPEDNDGCIYARFPAKWIKITPPKKMNLSDQRRQELSERFKMLRALQNEE